MKKLLVITVLLMSSAGLIGVTAGSGQENQSGLIDMITTVLRGNTETPDSGKGDSKNPFTLGDILGMFGTASDPKQFHLDQLVKAAAALKADPDSTEKQVELAAAMKNVEQTALSMEQKTVDDAKQAEGSILDMLGLGKEAPQDDTDKREVTIMDFLERIRGAAKSLGLGAQHKAVK